MKHNFTSQLLKVANRQKTRDLQLDLVVQMWPDLMEAFPTTQHDLIDDAFMDLAGLVEGVEHFTDDKAAAQRMLLLTVNSEEHRAKLVGLFESAGGARSAIGFFLVSCMRAVNRATHQKSALKEFKKLYDAMVIPVEGPWEACVEAVNFSAVNYVPEGPKGKVVAEQDAK